MRSFAGARGAPWQSTGLLRRCAARNDRLFFQGRWCPSLLWGSGLAPQLFRGHSGCSRG
jgi:hypothetical protein